MTLRPSKFLDPKSDVVFKKIFGHNIDLVKSFLNGVMPFQDGSLIETVSYLPTEQTPRIPSLKNTIVDVKCTDQQGRIFIIEMQMSWSANFLKRLLYGASKAYVQQLGSGENYMTLCPVYGLGIINEVFEHDTDAWFHHYRIINNKDANQVLEGIELMFLELPKFKPQTLEHRKMGILWLRFLREINERLVDVPQEFMDSPELNKAMELAQESSYTLGELDSYDKYWDAVRVEKTLMLDSEAKGIEIGKAAGIEIGKVEGIEIGKAAGIEIGKVEGIEIGADKAAIKIARNMLAEGATIDMIVKVTGISALRIAFWLSSELTTT